MPIIAPIDDLLSQVRKSGQRNEFARAIMAFDRDSGNVSQLATLFLQMGITVVRQLGRLNTTQKWPDTYVALCHHLGYADVLALDATQSTLNWEALHYLASHSPSDRQILAGDFLRGLRVYKMHLTGTPERRLYVVEDPRSTLRLVVGPEDVKPSEHTREAHVAYLMAQSEAILRAAQQLPRCLPSPEPAALVPETTHDRTAPEGLLQKLRMKIERHALEPDVMTLFEQAITVEPPLPTQDLLALVNQFNEHPKLSFGDHPLRRPTLAKWLAQHANAALQAQLVSRFLKLTIGEDPALPAFRALSFDWLTQCMNQLTSSEKGSPLLRATIAMVGLANNPGMERKTILEWSTILVETLRETDLDSQLQFVIRNSQPEALLNWATILVSSLVSSEFPISMSSDHGIRLVCYVLARCLSKPEGVGMVTQFCSRISPPDLLKTKEGQRLLVETIDYIRVANRDTAAIAVAVLSYCMTKDISDVLDSPSDTPAAIRLLQARFPNHELATSCFRVVDAYCNGNVEEFCSIFPGEERGLLFYYLTPFENPKIKCYFTISVKFLVDYARAQMTDQPNVILMPGHVPCFFLEWTSTPGRFPVRGAPADLAQFVTGPTQELPWADLAPSLHPFVSQQLGFLLINTNPRIALYYLTQLAALCRAINGPSATQAAVAERARDILSRSYSPIGTPSRPMSSCPELERFLSQSQSSKYRVASSPEIASADALVAAFQTFSLPDRPTEESIQLALNTLAKLGHFHQSLAEDRADAQIAILKEAYPACRTEMARFLSVCEQLLLAIEQAVPDRKPWNDRARDMVCATVLVLSPDHLDQAEHLLPIRTEGAIPGPIAAQLLIHAIHMIGMMLPPEETSRYLNLFLPLLGFQSRTTPKDHIEVRLRTTFQNLKQQDQPEDFCTLFRFLELYDHFRKPDQTQVPSKADFLRFLFHMVFPYLRDFCRAVASHAESAVLLKLSDLPLSDLMAWMEAFEKELQPSAAAAAPQPKPGRAARRHRG